MKYFRLSFSKKQIIINRVKLYTIIVLVLIVGFFDFRWIIRNIIENKPLPALSPIQFIIVICFFYLINWVGNKVLNYFDKKTDDYIEKIDNGKMGEEGEKLAYLEVVKTLTSPDYKIFRNVKLPGYRSDLDIVIVGPKGIFILEVKNHESITVLKNHKSYFINELGQEIPLEKDCRKTVDWQAECLGNYLFKCGLGSVHVHKALVFVNSRSVKIEGYENIFRVYVVPGLENLNTYLSETYNDPKFNADYCWRVNMALDKITYNNLSSEQITVS